MGKLIRIFCSFIGISGIGWIIDFFLYTLLVGALDLPVALANYISTIPAISFVFFVSTRKLFKCHQHGLRKSTKYVLYVVYQLILVTCVSFLAQWLGQIMPGLWTISCDGAKLMAKILITPVTMVCNFLVLKNLVEKW